MYVKSRVVVGWGGLFLLMILFFMRSVLSVSWCLVSVFFLMVVILNGVKLGLRV